MYIDNPAELHKALPRIVPRKFQTKGGISLDQFGESLLRNLHMHEPSHVEGMGVAAARMAPFWSDLFLAADSVGSQYDALRETLATSGPPAGNLACVAVRGRGFHGQHGRHWEVIEGNLHLSALLVCDLPAAEYAPVLPALPAVAVHDALRDLSGGRLPAGIKWVNDVMVRDRKIAGSLTALRTVDGQITAAVVGIGLNVNQAPLMEGPASRWAVTSLSDEMPENRPDLGQVLLAVLAALADRWRSLPGDGPGHLLSSYRDASTLTGRVVEVWPETGRADEPIARGEVLAIGPDLSLQLAGRDSPVTAGRVALVSPGT